MAMMAITTSSSISVKPGRGRRLRRIANTPHERMNWLCCASRGWASVFGRDQLLEPGLVGELHLAVGERHEAFAASASLLVGDQRRRGAADLGDDGAVADHERLAVTLRHESRIEGVEVHA